ncbi:16S rRNA (guanine(527)-N(7))-methyltransferase RsmG [Alloscardovia criceti]|uniref:16S rRNA (guanine(527)-N(7))-methyltransferase RsmG n=1 Tax=Alloscardovia criceti TaxID=356828 RepID=UPI000382D61B|nr:16S rRNA (guanine(527)-N(7))-methyltransferase RsmG [Alloscardovia criceti]
MTDILNTSPIPRQVLGDAFDKLSLFHQKLETEGEPRGIIGPRDVDIIWERHILNSAAIVPFLKKEMKDLSGAIGDIGSGGGFPGIIIAACMSQTPVYLVEPMERRVEWLHEVVEELDLSNVTIIRARAQEVVPGKIEPKILKQLPARFHGFDVATCRAVAPMTKLTGMVFPLIRPGGKLVTLKGRSVETELEKAAKEMKKYGTYSPRVFEAPVAEGLEPTRVLVLKKKQ